MKEIKFVSHLSRNIYLYFGLYFAIFFIAGHQISLQQLLLGLIAYFIGYAPIYFLNDYIDRHEDTKHKKSNLYTHIKRARLFWIIACTAISIGVGLSYWIDPRSVMLLLIMYACNILYSVEPFRLRNRPYLNLIIIFIIYAIKFYYVALLLHFPPLSVPASLIIMSASLGALSTAFYKRHIQRQKVSEYILSILFAVAWITTIVLYNQLFFLFFPLIFILVYFHFKYKTKQIPIGRYQLFYFVYSIIVWLVQSQFAVLI
ncbi:MAG: UbiA family prenyltransferase [Candidatus Levybacteria bacterium]|nr:UbiA family prenyltransferase [Candidatus Levybacteria bacterium]